MEEEKENSALKRQREPVSEDNVPSTLEGNDEKKRRRLEVAGWSPKPSSSGLQAEFYSKPDTPMVPSVRSRIQQLSRRREGASPLAQRCLSDPGGYSPSVSPYGRVFREATIGQAEFHQRLERFKGPDFQASPTQTTGQASTPQMTRSNFVSAIQQKLHSTPAPSSKQASRIHQEREEELNQLPFQPISENAWLKRSISDPASSRRDCDVGIKDGSFSEAIAACEEKLSSSGPDGELNSSDETNTSKIIDQMFEEVLECAESVGEEERRGDEYSGDPDSGIGVSPGNKDETEEASQKSGEEEEEEEEESKEEQCDESNRPECSSDELTFPPSGILSPLSRAVEAVVTPLRRAASREANPSSLLSTPEESHHPSPVEAAPLYSIEAYRTQRQNKLPTAQSVASGVQRQAPEKSQPQTSANTKEKIMALREEAGKLQTMIKQTLQALSCCTDEEHGRGSLEEAEAEKLLLVSSEKHSALQAEVARLRESGGDDEDGSQQPCRGTVRITNIQLPLKVEFVCSSHKRAGRPSHYFFVLIRYGPCNIIATPLATAADAQNGDTISFQTSITLKDIRSTFAIDVEVYSLSHISGSKFSVDQTSTKSRVTPRKLLNTITRSSNSVTSAALPALNTARSSSFVLVGSHQITLASLGHSKFPLDKMKLDGKIRRLLGDEFQEKVPFLSPLEGNIYLRLDSESHSDVQHQGFLTMFELIGGFGVWHRQYFVLVGCTMFHWNHPNDRETKEAEGSISLSSSHSRCVRTVKRDSCARPFTFELVSNVPEQQDASAKLWFSADSKQESLDWMEKLNQSLLDFNTWKQTSAAQVEAGQSDSCSSGKLRESIL
ncbi:anillin, actin binding protein 2 isoform X6 [Pungitius pungitius]|uniref:anillin, actin binding protein 2 isoform X6 n=1 Tax=Pungitius pungitius TaxID=134920 RepID=UPI002E11D8D7